MTHTIFYGHRDQGVKCGDDLVRANLEEDAPNLYHLVPVLLRARDLNVDTAENRLPFTKRTGCIL